MNISSLDRFSSVQQNQQKKGAQQQDQQQDSSQDLSNLYSQVAQAGLRQKPPTH